MLRTLASVGVRLRMRLPHCCPFCLGRTQLSYGRLGVCCHCIKHYFGFSEQVFGS